MTTEYDPSEHHESLFDDGPRAADPMTVRLLTMIDPHSIRDEHGDKRPASEWTYRKSGRRLHPTHAALIDGASESDYRAADKTWARRARDAKRRERNRLEEIKGYEKILAAFAADPGSKTIGDLVRRAPARRAEADADRAAVKSLEDQFIEG